MHAAAKRWASLNDRHRVPLIEIENAVAQAAQECGRDLSPDEVHAACVAFIRSWVHAEGQRQAEEAIAGARG